MYGGYNRLVIIRFINVPSVMPMKLQFDMRFVSTLINETTVRCKHTQILIIVQIRENGGPISHRPWLSVDEGFEGFRAYDIAVPRRCVGFVKNCWTIKLWYNFFFQDCLKIGKKKFRTALIPFLSSSTIWCCTFNENLAFARIINCILRNNK